MDNAIAVLPRGANLKPSAVSLAFFAHGKSGVCWCVALGHANALARLQMQRKMLLLTILVIVVQFAGGARVVPPRVKPVERVP